MTPVCPIHHVQVDLVMGGTGARLSCWKCLEEEVPQDWAKDYEVTVTIKKKNEYTHTAQNNHGEQSAF